MTTLGKIYVYKCSNCSISFKNAGFGSGNTFGAKFYTDGFCHADMMPVTLSLVKCPSCRQLVCLSKLELQDESGFDWEGAERFYNIDFRLDPTLEDYYSFVNSSDLIPEYEPYVRVLIWWLENNKRRNIPKRHRKPLSERERTNLNSLLKFTDESENNDLFIRIELFRELSDFKRALRLLQNSTEEKNSNLVKEFRVLIENNDPFVSQFTEGGISIRCLKVTKYTQYKYKLFHEAKERNNKNAYYALGYMYSRGEGLNPDQKMSRDLYAKAAELGNVKAQLLLGDWYYHGKNVKQDFEISKTWLSPAAEAGDQLAQCLIGDIYYYGKLGNCDLAEAFKWYTKSAELGNAESQFNLAHMYMYGEWVEKNQETARYWIGKSSCNNNPNAHYVLAWSYFNGDGVEQDKPLAIQFLCRALEQADTLSYQGVNSEEIGISDQERLVAVDWFNSEAHSGNISAMYLLGMLFYNGLLVEKCIKSAFKWLTKAAIQGSSQAQFLLGKQYECGYGVNKDIELAIEWYKKSAEQGNLDAQKCLGFGYFIGGFEKKKKPNWQDDVLHWYTMAAEQGDAEAQSFLGLFYAMDKWKRVDKKKSIDCYVKAAKQGNENSQFALGLLFFNCEIVELDKTLAGEWYIEK